MGVEIKMDGGNIVELICPNCKHINQYKDVLIELLTHVKCTKCDKWWKVINSELNIRHI